MYNVCIKGIHAIGGLCTQNIMTSYYYTVRPNIMKLKNK